MGYIGKQGACDSTSMLKLLDHYFEGLGKVLKVAWAKPSVLFLKDSSIWHCWLNTMMPFLVNKSRSILRDTHLKCFTVNISKLSHSCARLEMVWPLVAPLANACGFLTMEQRASTPLFLSR